MPAEATSAHRISSPIFWEATDCFLPRWNPNQRRERALFVAQDSAYYYATYSKTGVDNLQEQVSSGRTRGFTKVSHGYILDLGYCEAGEEVKVTNTANELVQLVVYRLDLMAFRTAYEALAAQTVEVTEVSDTRVKGNVDVTQAGRLIFFHRG